MGTAHRRRSRLRSLRHSRRDVEKEPEFLMIEIDIPISRHIWWTQNRPKPHMGNAIPAEENRQTHRPSHLPRPHQPERGKRRRTRRPTGRCTSPPSSTRSHTADSTPKRRPDGQGHPRRGNPGRHVADDNAGIQHRPLLPARHAKPGQDHLPHHHPHRTGRPTTGSGHEEHDMANNEGYARLSNGLWRNTKIRGSPEKTHRRSPTG